MIPRRGRSVVPVLLCLLAGSLAAGRLRAAPEAPASGGEIWITLGADAFEVANRALPRRSDGPALARVAELGGVVITRVPSELLPVLGEEIHHQLLRCGGFVTHASRQDAEAELARLAAVSLAPEGALGFAIDQPRWVEQVAGLVSEANILATITALSTQFPNRYHLHPSGASASTWIHDLWAGYAAGRPEVTVEQVSHANTPQKSVVLTLPGSLIPEEVVILGAHLDSTSSGSSNPNFSAPGADDDASGIASLSEALRAALAAGFAPQRTIRFIAYAAEEVGLRGSTAIATQYQTDGTNVVAVLQQDMTGYHGSTEDVTMITDFTNATLTAFVVDLIETYQPELQWTTGACGYACSDHAPWHSRGYPAAFAFEARFGQYNPTIHTVNDTLATIGNSAAHAAKFSRLAAAFLVEVGSDLGPDIFADGFEVGDTSAWSLTVP